MRRWVRRSVDAGSLHRPAHTPASAPRLVLGVESSAPTGRLPDTWRPCSRHVAAAAVVATVPDGCAAGTAGIPAGHGLLPTVHFLRLAGDVCGVSAGATAGRRTHDVAVVWLSLSVRRVGGCGGQLLAGTMAQRRPAGSPARPCEQPGPRADDEAAPAAGHCSPAVVGELGTIGGPDGHRSHPPPPFFLLTRNSERSVLRDIGDGAALQHR